jgi:hypothetical protein
MGFSQELLELVVLSFKLSKLAASEGSMPPKRERHL